MEKFIYLAPSVDLAESVIATLESMGVEREQMSAITNEDNNTSSLPDASVEEASDVVPAAMRGASLGGAVGLVAGLAAIAFPPAGFVVGGAAAALTTGAGASFGVFASALIGSSVPNSQLRQYEDAVKRGEVLLVIDMDRETGNQADKEVAAAHPDVNVQGALNTLPPAL